MFDNDLYVGDIKVCTKYVEKPLVKADRVSYESEIYKENAKLIKTINGGFVDLANLNFYNYWKLRMDGAEFYSYNDLNMDVRPQTEEQLFVDEESLRILVKDIFEKESFPHVKQKYRT